MLRILSNQITEETQEKVLKMRIAGLYLLVSRGSDLEKLTVRSQGVNENELIKVQECSTMWNILVRLCMSFSVCLHVTWISYRVGFDPSEVKRD